MLFLSCLKKKNTINTIHYCSENSSNTELLKNNLLKAEKDCYGKLHAIQINDFIIKDASEFAKILEEIKQTNPKINLIIGGYGTPDSDLKYILPHIDTYLIDNSCGTGRKSPY